MKATLALWRLTAHQPRTILMMTQRGMRSRPVFKEEDENKINKFNGDLAAYFDDLMRRRPHTPSGYITLPQENFKAMIERAKTSTDIATLVNAYANYLGHRNILPHAVVDTMLSKALEVGNPEGVLEVLRLHSELIYHPNPALLVSFFNHFKAASYESFKAFFTALRGNHLIIKPQGFHIKSIVLASANKDAKTVIHAYLDILNYQTAGMMAEHLSMVFESLNYESAIDHGLVEHLGKTAGNLGFAQDSTIKLHQALYFFKSKGYLSAVDILKEVGASSSQTKIGTSEQLKNQFFTPLFDTANEIDADAKGQLVEAIKAIP